MDHSHSSERDRLIAKLTYLTAISNAKQEKYRKETGAGPEVGYLTKEALMIAALVPEMIRLGVTPDDGCPSGSV